MYCRSDSKITNIAADFINLCRIFWSNKEKCRLWITSNNCFHIKEDCLLPSHTYRIITPTVYYANVLQYYQSICCLDTLETVLCVHWQNVIKHRMEKTTSDILQYCHRPCFWFAEKSSVQNVYKDQLSMTTAVSWWHLLVYSHSDTSCCQLTGYYKCTKLANNSI